MAALAGAGSGTDAAVVDALDAVAAALRSGAPLRDALGAAGHRGSIAPVMRAVVARADAGAGMRAALARCASAQPDGELRLALGSMVLAVDTGAAHASTLDLVAQRARERMALAREVRAMSASARASAAVVVAAPVAVLALVLAFDRLVVSRAAATGLGRASILAGLGCDAAGAVWMRRLLRRPLVAFGAQDPRDGLAEAVDLLAMALAAGLGVPAAVEAAAPHAPGQAGRALRVTAARLSAGVAPAAALAPVPRLLGDDARPLVTALLAAHLDGAPIGHVLDRLASDYRHARRQRATERVQRLPVLLLFPLVCCVLPAFVLLTVLPLAVGSLGALRS